MQTTEALIEAAYAAFNGRDVDGALALMREDVDWPKASEDGRARGKEEFRAYWMRQWREFDPRVEPMEIVVRDAGRAEVTVHQVVKDLHGEVLFDGPVWHVFTVREGLIERMEVVEGAGAFGR